MNSESIKLLKEAAYYIKKAEFEKQSGIKGKNMAEVWEGAQQVGKVIGEVAQKAGKTIGEGVQRTGKAISEGAKNVWNWLRGGGKTVEAPKSETPRTFYQIPDNELYIPGEISATGNPVFTPEAAIAARHAMDDGYWGFKIKDMYAPVDGYNYGYHYIPHNPGRYPLRSDFDGFFAGANYKRAVDKWMAFNRDRAAHPSRYPFDAKLFEKNITEGVKNHDFPQPRKLSPYQYRSPREQKMLDQTVEQLYPFRVEKPLGIMRDWTERTFTPEYKFDLKTQILTSFEFFVKL